MIADRFSRGCCELGRLLPNAGKDVERDKNNDIYQPSNDLNVSVFCPIFGREVTIRNTPKII